MSKEKGGKILFIETKIYGDKVFSPGDVVSFDRDDIVDRWEKRGQINVSALDSSKIEKLIESKLSKIDFDLYKMKKAKQEQAKVEPVKTEQAKIEPTKAVVSGKEK